MSSSDPCDLGPRELLQIFAIFFENHSIDYRVVGSMASIAYGENRFTNDVDIVADLCSAHVAPLCQYFQPPNYFLAPHAIEEAIKKRSQFNIIHIPAGLKADIMLPKQTPFANMEHRRARRLTDPDGLSAIFASPEDVILNKLIFYRLGESDKHLRDIAGILKVMGAELDLAYIADWTTQLGVSGPWGLVQQRVRESS